MALRELIDAKIENRPPEAIDEPQIGAKVIDLMEALKRSVGGKTATDDQEGGGERQEAAGEEVRRQGRQEGAGEAEARGLKRSGGAGWPTVSASTAKSATFAKTAEPSGEASRRKAGGYRYLIQKHAATRLHFDFRLELDGVLLCWAVPAARASTPRTSASPSAPRTTRSTTATSRAPSRRASTAAAR